MTEDRELLKQCCSEGDFKVSHATLLPSFDIVLLLGTVESMLYALHQSVQE